MDAAEPPGRNGAVTMRMRRICGWLAAGLLPLLGFAQQPVVIKLPATHAYSAVRLQLGDDPRWAAADYDDSAWRDVTQLGVPTRAGVFWVRYRVRGKGALPAGVFLKISAAFELYWDGKLVGRSGVPGNSAAEETPGKLDTAFSIPGEWLRPDALVQKIQAGEAASANEAFTEHVIALRASTYLCGFPGEWTDLNVRFVDPAERLAAFNKFATEPAAAAGAMFMLALITLLMWLIADRRPALLLFHGVCACAAVVQTLTVLRYVNGYTYDWHYPVRLGTVCLSGALGLCLIAFVCLHFAVPRRWWWLGAFALVSAAIVWLPREVYYLPLVEKAGTILHVAFVVALGASGWAAMRKQRGAWPATAGALMSAWPSGAPVEGNFFPTFLPLLVGLLCAVALRLREERGRAEETRLAAARLEVELLRKNLQPHFFLNTLTALSEVVERDPRGAVNLIEDLAGEFRVMSRMSGEKQVPLGEELELCRAHLRVMSTRTGVACRLEAEGVDDNARVPPALFLTLIENAFVHQRTPVGAELVFHLRVTLLAQGVRYTFFSPGEIKPRRKRADGGTGMRYVKARLEESFAGRWTLRHGPEADGWQTVIELGRASGPAPAAATTGEAPVLREAERPA